MRVEISSRCAQVLLDRAVLPLGRMELLPDCEGAAAGTDGDGGGSDGADAGPEFVRMDASALENLEVPRPCTRPCACRRFLVFVETTLDLWQHATVGADISSSTAVAAACLQSDV